MYIMYSTYIYIYIYYNNMYIIICILCIVCIVCMICMYVCTYVCMCASVICVMCIMRLIYIYIEKKIIIQFVINFIFNTLSLCIQELCELSNPSRFT